MLFAFALVAAAAASPAPVASWSGLDANLPALPSSAPPPAPQPSLGAPAPTAPFVTGRFGLKSYDVSRSPRHPPNTLRLKK